jgi:putative transcriptional regulator
LSIARESRNVACYTGLMNYGKIIKELRDKLLLSQTEMANKLGVSFATINRWENRRHEPTMRYRRKIRDLCHKTGVEFDVR